MKKAGVAATLWLVVGSSFAGFVDNRSIDSIVEVNYRSISVEDLVADIVPSAFQITYARAELRKRELKLNGKGTWQQLLTQAANSSNVTFAVNATAKQILIADQIPAAATAAPAAPAPTVAAVGMTPLSPVRAATASTIERTEPVWVVKPGSFLRAVLNEYAARAGWVVEYNYKDAQTLEEKDLRLGGGMRIEGDFKKFVKELFASLPESAKIRAELWSENDPPTVYVFRKGVER